jgi:hypothetical protein
VHVNQPAPLKTAGFSFILLVVDFPFLDAAGDAGAGLVGRCGGKYDFQAQGGCCYGFEGDFVVFVLGHAGRVAGFNGLPLFAIFI